MEGWNENAHGYWSKNYYQFNLETCMSIQSIEIIRKTNCFEDTQVFVDGKLLTEKEVNQLTLNDGFDNLAEFYIWFDAGFKGKILHWTYLQY